MRYYFKISFRILSRISYDSGVPIWLAIFLIFGIVVILGFICLRYPEYGIYIIPYINIMVLLPLTGYERNKFLIQHFGKINKVIIRFLENLFLSLPTLLIAFVFLKLEVSIFIILLVVIMSEISFGKATSSIPTPFKRYPFEFIVYLRRGFYLAVILAFSIIFIAIYANNFNLGIVVLGLLSLIALSAHQIRENELYVWNYNLSPSKFLRLKILRSIWQFVVLVIPSIILLLMGFSSKYIAIFSVLVTGAVLQTFAIILKYSVYPKALSIQDAIFILIISIFPPLLLLVMVKYYKRAKVNLSNML